MAVAPRINLIIGSHAHVPPGAAKEEFEAAYDKRLKPFASSLYKHPKINAVLHYSGPLLNWIERTHPEFIMLIEEMVSRKQAEIMGGGFYEPMFPLIPVQDRIDQIEFMTTYLRRHFGKRPAGCWLPAFAWEQQLVSALAASGMNYTFLSQRQFEKAGIRGGGLARPCLSEDMGKLVTVFPVSSFLERELAAKSVSAVFDALKNDSAFWPDEAAGVAAGAEATVSVFPESAPLCGESESAESAWNRFFEELSLCEELVVPVLPGKLAKGLKGLKKASFPNSSGLESGYLPRNFIIENAGSGGVYAKMMFINALITQIKGDKSRKRSAREELWKSQDSAIFTPFCEEGKRHELIKTAYHSLLSAERLSRERGKFEPSLIQHDFDLDGSSEYLFQDKKLNCYIQLTGAGIFELDYMPKAWNYLACGCDSEGLRRTAFADIFLPKDAAGGFEKGLPEGARACFREQYEAASKAGGKAVFRLKAVQSHPLGALSITKAFSIKKDTLTVSYEVKNTGKADLDFCFASELNFSFPGEGEEFVRFEATSDGKADGYADGEASALKIMDLKNEVKILLGSQQSFAFSIIPAARGGTYQPARITPFFSIFLKNGELWKNEFNLSFFD
ncbi:MAG: DUF1926 domain-containing protein [Spirochaetes bacterium]|nr:DUF1926 domain-containing protein [Spirochaetota bacterium]